MRIPCGLWAVGISIAICTVATASGLWADEPRSTTIDDPDAQLQGEYAGEVACADGKSRLGIQVVALGKGKFRAFSRKGGLPGDGWDNDEIAPRDAEVAGGETLFTWDRLAARLRDGVMTVTQDGAVTGTLKRIVRQSSTLGAKPPSGAVVLFDGTSDEHFADGRITKDGWLMQGATTRFKHQSGSLHIEFRVPFAPLVPTRGNSGVYLQSRYELQILDSFGQRPHNHECGGIPSIKEPELNMSFPSGTWQTYDVDFVAARFTEGKKTASARITVRHNGVIVHDDLELTHATTSSPLPEGPEAGPINLQDHQAEVRYRNIWFVPAP